MANWQRLTAAGGKGRVWVNLDHAIAIKTIAPGSAGSSTGISLLGEKDILQVTESVEDVASKAQKSNA